MNDKIRNTAIHQFAAGVTYEVEGFAGVVVAHAKCVELHDDGRATFDIKGVDTVERDGTYRIMILCDACWNECRVGDDIRAIAIVRDKHSENLPEMDRETYWQVVADRVVNSKEKAQ